MPWRAVPRHRVVTSLQTLTQACHSLHARRPQPIYAGWHLTAHSSGARTCGLCTLGLWGHCMQAAWKPPEPSQSVWMRVTQACHGAVCAGVLSPGDLRPAHPTCGGATRSSWRRRSAPLARCAGSLTRTPTAQCTRFKTCCERWRLHPTQNRWLQPHCLNRLARCATALRSGGERRASRPDPYQGIC